MYLDISGVKLHTVPLSPTCLILKINRLLMGLSVILIKACLISFPYILILTITNKLMKKGKLFWCSFMVEKEKRAHRHKDIHFCWCRWDVCFVVHSYFLLGWARRCMCLGLDPVDNLEPKGEKLKVGTEGPGLRKGFRGFTGLWSRPSGGGITCVASVCRAEAPSWGCEVSSCTAGLWGLTMKTSLTLS